MLEKTNQVEYEPYRRVNHLDGLRWLAAAVVANGTLLDAAITNNVSNVYLDSAILGLTSAVSRTIRPFNGVHLSTCSALRTWESLCYFS
jgi:hypothetical protein